MTSKKPAEKKNSELLAVTTFYEQSLGIPETIDNEEDAFRASDLLLAVRRKYNELEGKMEERTKPAQETIRLIKDDYKQFLLPLEEMEGRLKVSLEGYADSRVREDYARLEEARAETNDHTLTMPIGISVLPGSSIGEIRFKRKMKLNVIDEKLVPKKYKTTVTVIDYKQMEEDIQNEGIISMPGVEISEKSSASIYANKK